VITLLKWRKEKATEEVLEEKGKIAVYKIFMLMPNLRVRANFEKFCE